MLYVIRSVKCIFVLYIYTDQQPKDNSFKANKNGKNHMNVTLMNIVCDNVIVIKIFVCVLALDFFFRFYPSFPYSFAAIHVDHMSEQKKW